MSLNSILMAVYFLTAFSQLSRKRFIFVFVSGALFMMHNWADPLLSDQMYYFTSAIVNGSCVLVAFLLSPIDSVIRKLQISCFAFIILDTYGFIIWFFYMPPVSYDMACTVVYLCMLKSSLRCEASIDMADNSSDLVHFHRGEGLRVSHKNGGNQK